MSVRARVRRASAVAPELEITAFMNLMVALVPFLLLTAVFSQLSIIELNLPPASAPGQQSDQPLVREFEVIVRSDQIVVADTVGGPLKVFDVTGGKYDMKPVSEILVALKSRFPEKENITLLLEPDIPYDTLVQIMDTVRVVDVVEAGSVVKKELFPLIAIGDAPPIDGVAR